MTWNLSPFSTIARSTSRPMRPKPLIPTLVAMNYSPYLYRCSCFDLTPRPAPSAGKRRVHCIDPPTPCQAIFSRRVKGVCEEESWRSHAAARSAFQYVLHRHLG